MKILNILLSNHVGGPTLRVLETSNRLKNRGWDVIILFPKEKGNFKHFVIEKGFKYHQIYLYLPTFFNSFESIMKNIKWLASIPISALKIYLIIKNEDVDIVHLHGLLNISGALAAKLAGKKLVWHLVGSVYPKWLIHLLMPFVIRTSDQMVFIANGLCRYYLDEKKDKLKNNYTIIYNGIDIEKFNPLYVNNEKVKKLKIEFGITNNRVIGCLGNINPAKGYEYFINAAHTLKMEFNDLKFIIVGSEIESQEKYYKKIKRLIRDLGMEDSIILAGGKKEIPEILSLFDIFVLTSVAEGTPMVILEAMSMKKPIVATDVGAVKEQIVNNVDGIIIKPQNTLEIVRSITYLLENENLAYLLGINARESAKKKFSINRSIDNLVLVYNNLFEI